MVLPVNLGYAFPPDVSLVSAQQPDPLLQGPSMLCPSAHIAHAVHTAHPARALFHSPLMRLGAQTSGQPSANAGQTHLVKCRRPTLTCGTKR